MPRDLLIFLWVGRWCSPGMFQISIKKEGSNGKSCFVFNILSCFIIPFFIILRIEVAFIERAVELINAKLHKMERMGRHKYKSIIHPLSSSYRLLARNWLTIFDVQPICIIYETGSKTGSCDQSNRLV